MCSEHVHYCERCKRELNPDTMVWLEVNSHTDTAHYPDKKEVPKEQSQGLFTFGPDCARTIMRRGGKNPFRT